MLPPPSKKGSCKPCRERKAECDKKRPRCGACVSASRTCGGWDNPSIFININSAGPPPVWNRAANAQKYLVVDWESQAGAGQQALSWEVSGAEATRSMTSAPLPPPPSALPTSIASYSSPDTSNINELVDHFLKLYYRRFNPDNTTDEPLQPGSEFGGWRSLIPQWIGRSPVLDTAIKALAACFIGAQDQNESLHNAAGTLYESALQQCQYVLNQPDSPERKHLLATALVLSSFEQMMSRANGDGQVTHIRGATHLLYYASPAPTFEEFHMHILTQGLSQALISRSPYIFSSTSLHLQNHPNTNAPLLQWTTLILPLPNLLHAIDNLLTSPSTSPTHPRTLYTDLKTLATTLSTWHESLKQTIHHPRPWIPPSSPQTNLSPTSVPFPLHFPSIQSCTLHVLYWTSQLLLLDAQARLLSHTPLLGAQAPDLKSMQKYAESVCRSVQFCTRGRSFAAAENVFLPLSVVAGWYERTGDEERRGWCVRALEGIAGEQGIGFEV
ncbi:hypothetical protein B0J11DRAFT_567341 [Dendryphion nanum]|uniref:Zn(2)-C6 fungal-type domain-containing protein n=1 Tax=Dendryphion nanum TaxID=256645 RepID=A0A9P9IRU8_9PLEO|nr:hypothetical protein B0J11DRAFT_567341 [Dendryphion nanum]